MSVDQGSDIKEIYFIIYLFYLILMLKFLLLMIKSIGTPVKCKSKNQVNSVINMLHIFSLQFMCVINILQKNIY